MAALSGRNGSLGSTPLSYFSRTAFPVAVSDNTESEFFCGDNFYGSDALFDDESLDSLGHRPAEKLFCIPDPLFFARIVRMERIPS